MKSSPTLPSFSGRDEARHVHITGLEVAVCPMELPYPVRLGPIEYVTRDYVAVRIRTEVGIDGYALGYTRGTPIPQALQMLAPEILGQDAHALRAIVEGLQKAHAPALPALGRAFSLVDIALWDILSKTAALPLYKLLGAYRDQVPVMAVAGYYLDRRSVEAVEEEVLARASEGYRTIKVGIQAVDPRADEAFVSRLRGALDAHIDLGVDAHSAWSDLETALATCRRLDALGLAFLEDACSPQNWRLLAELQRHLRTPLAAGEEAAMIEQLEDLLDAVTILRIDATANGGLTVAITATQMAGVRGRSVSPHVFAPLHSQLAGALSSIRLVEVIPPEVGADPVSGLLHSEPVIQEGMLVLDQRPGNGLDLDWDAVLATASEIISLPA